MRKEGQKIRSCKRNTALLLATALIAGNLVGNVWELWTDSPSVVNARDSRGTDRSAPGADTYATGEELQKNYDLVDDTEEKPVQKVYFGCNGDTGNTPQVWKIAGKDPKITGENIVLFADSPMTVSDQRFAASDGSVYEKQCTPSELGITYGESVVPDKGAGEIPVYINHYGSSILREQLGNMTGKTVTDGAATYTATNYFTQSQQERMNETTITTNDRHGSNGNYTTTDILYAAYGDYEEGKDDHVTVGTNKYVSGSLNNGLRIDRSNWGEHTF